MTSVALTESEIWPFLEKKIDFSTKSFKKDLEFFFENFFLFYHIFCLRRFVRKVVSNCKDSVLHMLSWNISQKNMMKKGPNKKTKKKLFLFLNFYSIWTV